MGLLSAAFLVVAAVDFAVLVWAASRLLRGALSGGTDRDEGTTGPPPPPAESGSESLVSCGHCGIRFPEGEAIRITAGNDDLLVCSEACRKQVTSG